MGSPMRLGLRTRLMAAFVGAALLPMAAVGLWARSVIVDLSESEHERRVASTVVSARDRVRHRLEVDRRGLVPLCQRDHGLRVIGKALATSDAPGPQSWHETAAAIRGALQVDRVELRVVRAPGLPRGALLGASPTPVGTPDPDPGLVAAALATDDAFVAPASEHGDAASHELIQACESVQDTTRLAVLTARTLDRGFLRELMGDVTPIALERADAPPGIGPDRRTVHTFQNPAGQPAVRVVAHLEGDPLAAQLARLDRGFAVAGAAAVLLAVVLGALLAVATTRPLRELERAARRVGRGDLESTIGGVHGGEVGDALEAFDRMTRELKRTRARLLRAERIAAWRDIARRIAHEIKNPLSPIQMSIETMRKTYAKRHPDFDEIFEESTQAVLEEVDRLKRIVSEFSRFARMPRPRPEALNVAEVADHVVGLHRDGPVPAKLSVEPCAPVLADREQLTQVLTNLVQNAIDACRGKKGGQVRVRVGPAERGEGVELLVDDDGDGIAEPDRDRIFEPYYTTKEGGTGLGLAIVHRIVMDHGGDIEVEASPSGGARFRVWLRPEGPPPEADASMTDTALPLVQRRER
jgi:two-component system, NtrC family, nitrogen regulation sensor histidine kinase NtrY